MRATEEEARELVEAAHREGLRFSAWARGVLLGAAKRHPMDAAA